MKLIQEGFIPDLKQLIEEVSGNLRLMRSNIGELAPYCKQYLLSIGCDVQLTEKCNESIIEYCPDIVPRKTNQVLYMG